MQNLKVNGFFLLDVDVVALNNAGQSIISNNENVVATKKVSKNNKWYAYISGQALGAWWRDTLQRDYNWELSPIVRESKTAFTAANPFIYRDDDVFGYMKAAKEARVDEETGEIRTDTKGKPKMEDVTVTRVAPLKKSAIVSVGPVGIARNWSSMARQEGDAVPYFKEEYSAIMKGQFSLDVAQVGTFSTYNRTGFKNLTEHLKEYALVNGCEEVDDPHILNSNGLPHKLIRLPKEEVLQRSVDTIKALLTISGGAMQTNNMADVTPKFLILAFLTSGNHPFGLICSEKIKNLTDLDDSDGRIEFGNLIQFSVAGIAEVLKDYRRQIVGSVFIGRRTGFLDQFAEELRTLENLPADHPTVKIGSIGDAIDGFCDQLRNLI